MANDFKEEYFSLALGVREGLEKLGRGIQLSVVCCVGS